MEKVTDRYTGLELWLIRNWAETLCVEFFSVMEDFRRARAKAKAIAKPKPKAEGEEKNDPAPNATPTGL